MTPEEPVVQAVHQALAALPAGASVVVAYSGGIDSTALLHALVQVVSPGRVLACHVHHGLQRAADRFAEHCAAGAQALGVRFDVRRLAGQPARGESIEAWAREHRYRALVDSAREAQAAAVLTAHHADDQAETLLIGLARGSGLDGLSGIQAAGERDGIRVLRPLLAVSRTHLAAYCTRWGLRAVHDPMNDDLTLLRSALRAKVMPVLSEVAPGFVAQAARSAGLIADAANLALEVAQSDLANAVQAGGELHLTALAPRSRARQANALRHWLRLCGAPVPSQARLAALCAQAFDSRSAHALWRHAGWSVVRYRNWLQALSPLVFVRPDQPAPDPWTAAWSGEPAVDVPGWALSVQILPASLAQPDAWFIERTALEEGPIVVRAAGARTRVRPTPKASSREVRKRWQERGVPPWLRAWLPEVRVGERTLGVVALGGAASAPGMAAAGATADACMAVSVRLLNAQDPRARWVLPYN